MPSLFRMDCPETLLLFMETKLRIPIFVNVPSPPRKPIVQFTPVEPLKSRMASVAGATLIFPVQLIWPSNCPVKVPKSVNVLAHSNVFPEVTLYIPFVSNALLLFMRSVPDCTEIVPLLF